MLKFLAFFGVGFASFALGTFGFAQIIGSLQTIRIRGIGLTLYTVIFWLILLAGGAALVLQLIPQYKLALYIAYAVSFLIMLGQKNIE